MSWKSLVVNIDIDGPIVPVIKAAIDLARRHEAKLIGLCAADAPPPMNGPEAAIIAAEDRQQSRDDIVKRFKEVRAAFDQLSAGSVKTEWREHLMSATDAVVEASRSADIIVMQALEGASTGDAYRIADPANVVLRAGRPLLILAGKAEQVSAKKIVVAWKDTREARRAVADAVPLLAAAEEVTVLTIAAQIDQWIREGLEDVITFLAMHNVKARPELIESADDHIDLLKFIGDSQADLVVSGAYGHSRLREWAFGGMTRSLLDETRLNRFMSN